MMRDPIRKCLLDYDQLETGSSKMDTCYGLQAYISVEQLLGRVSPSIGFNKIRHT